MTQRGGSGPDALTGLDRVWPVPDAQVASGRIPGYVAAVRVGGQVAVRAGGRMAVGAESAPMREDTLFRIASVTKPIGGALPARAPHPAQHLEGLIRLATQLQAPPARAAVRG